MSFSFRLRSPSMPALLRFMAIAALASGIGIWGAVLLAPQPGPLPAALTRPPPRAVDNTAVALWFGKDEVLRMQISVLGVIAGGPDGAAILSVDGGAPVALRAGQEVAPGVYLRDVSANQIVIEQHGVETSLNAPAALESSDGIRATP